MSNAPLTIRSLLVFGTSMVLAIFLGYVVASPLDWMSLVVFGLILLTFSFPILLRWHHPLMILAWNMNAIVFILPGRPPLWLFMVLVSILFSLGHFALNKQARYPAVPTVIFPLLFLSAVVLATAKFTGGIGLGSLGGETAGGKRYFFLLGAILGFFALTCYQIAPRHGRLYTILFFMGGASVAIGNLLPLMNPAFYFIFYIFPPEQSGMQALGLMQESAVTRFGGLAYASSAVFATLLACYGIRGIFDFSGPFKFLPFRIRGGIEVNKPWRLIFFVIALVASLFGGFRSVVVILALTFFFQFCYERLFHTRLFPTFIIVGILTAIIALPMAGRLPLSVQRAISVLPFVEVDPIARHDAESSTQWRLEMWKQVLPQVPKYFFLGKGYGISSEEMQFLGDQNKRTQIASSEIAIIAGDYHNGPLSLIMPFGIWGVIGFVWFLGASIKMLLRNYRYGDPALTNINRFLLAYFVARTVFFFAVFGSLYSDMAYFTGIVGLSIALNGGVRSKPHTASQTVATARDEVPA